MDTVSGPNIELRGPWAIWWGLWHVVWLAGLFWASVFLDGDGMRWWFRVLYTAFLVPEVYGAYRNTRTSDHVARTLSEVRQWVSARGKGSKATGWKGLAAGTAFVDAAAVYWVVSDVWMPLGAILGCVVWMWLAPHFGWRERVG